MRKVRGGGDFFPSSRGGGGLTLDNTMEYLDLIIVTNQTTRNLAIGGQLGNELLLVTLVHVYITYMYQSHQQQLIPKLFVDATGARQRYLLCVRARARARVCVCVCVCVFVPVPSQSRTTAHKRDSISEIFALAQSASVANCYMQIKKANKKHPIGCLTFIFYQKYFL